ncbi:hypothetical protein [Fluviispira multicolorata]|uniref:Uncharacterized protein n=1 Tax=Fluviispira multicolorata TaxID=2654512 RepID=A0A833JD28_9BACT|nr:hypothetical protein [Fluviispira multicolorata]KAB8031046.1 hypothetical protein GCL57_08755 [Fluviispira multicolorata]
MYFANKLKNKFIFVSLIQLCLLNSSTIYSQSIDDNRKSIKIEGEPEGADVSDIPLSPFEYDFDTFNTGFKPEKELLNLLDRPEELAGITEKDLSLDFDIKK